MKHGNSVVVAGALLAALAWGCGEDPTCVDCDYCWGCYLPQTSPENVLHNLQSSYERREIEEYAKLLDPTFIFKFQQADIPPGLPRDYWNRDEDSTGTAALFNATTEVSKISLDLGTYSAKDAGRADEPGAELIRLTNVKLEVEQYNGTTLLVQGDIQDMYFRRGSVAAGTDTTKWYLFEWWDKSGGGSLKPAIDASGHASDIAQSRPLTSPISWGRIKSMFR